MEKYYKEDLSVFERSKKNQKLYNDVSKEISDLENLPVPDNSNEIDLDGLKQIIYSRDEYRKAKEVEKAPLEEEAIEKKPTKDAKIYDINVLLENAKNEINRSSEVTNEKKISHNFLTNLEEEKIPNNDDAIEIANMEHETTDTDENSLPLDLLVDLKGTDNTVVTDPIVKEEVTMIKKIKDGETFYSGSFNFKKKDFDDDDDDFVIAEEHNALKVIFLIMGLVLLVAAIYFIMTKYVL